MDFRTTIPIKPEEPKIGYHSRMVLLGSCFVNNIGNKFEYFKFRTLINPYGILFHPEAILGVLRRVQGQKKFNEQDIFYHNEAWHCFQAHSELSHPDKKILLNRLNTALRDLDLALKGSTHVIITFGTAWAYRSRDSGKTVTNCHKLPQNHFEKDLRH